MITEPAVRRHIVVRDADHLPSGSRKVFKVITKSLSLDGASRRFVFRIKIKNQFPALEILQRAHAAVVILQRKIRCGLPDF